MSQAGLYLYSTVIACSEAHKILQLLPPFRTLHGTHKSPLRNLTRPELQPGFCQRILALHGARINRSVTNLQLENLRITEDEYDIA